MINERGFFFLNLLPPLLLAGAVASLPHLSFVQELLDRGDAISAAAEAQKRINVKFTEFLLGGMSCDAASDAVADLALTSDGRGEAGEIFMGYAVTPRYIERNGTLLTLQAVAADEKGQKRRFENLVVIQAPRCGVDELMSSGLSNEVTDRLNSRLPDELKGSAFDMTAESFFDSLRDKAAEGVAEVRRKVKDFFSGLMK